MIAMALALNPKLLIADEPTTALDVTVQAQILELMKRLQADLGMAIILITHDLGVLADIADEVLVMYAGQVMERGPRRTVYHEPHHPYTSGLIEALPSRGRGKGRLRPIPGMPPSSIGPPRGLSVPPALPVRRSTAAAPSGRRSCRVGGDGHTRPAGCPLDQSRLGSCRAVEAAMTGVEPDASSSVENVVKHFPVESDRLSRRSDEQVHAVDGVSLEIRRGETLGIVGETGCGKSTLARCITRLYDLTSGRVVFDGHDITTLSRRRSCGRTACEMQMIFQDPYSSLNPRRRVGSIIGDPFAIHGIADGAEPQARRSSS